MLAPMIDPAAFDPRAYVAAVAPAMGLALSPERAAAVAEALALVARVAAPALGYGLPEHEEPAPVFAPGVFAP